MLYLNAYNRPWPPDQGLYCPNMEVFALSQKMIVLYPTGVNRPEPVDREEQRWPAVEDPDVLEWFRSV